MQKEVSIYNVHYCDNIHNIIVKSKPEEPS